MNTETTVSLNRGVIAPTPRSNPLEAPTAVRSQATVKRASGYSGRSVAYGKRSATISRPTAAYTTRKTGNKNVTRATTTATDRVTNKKRARKSVANPAKAYVRKRHMALLLPGHNEELILAHTIQSALVAGQPKRDIYVVDDNSDDRTREIAISMLGEKQVLSVSRSGKALAVQKGIIHFEMETRYTWLHIADADSIFSPDYFREYRKKLDPKKYAVAVGFVQSLRGNWISTYRALAYTFSQHVNRRIQAKLGMISVFPGPITCFRMDIWKELELDSASLTEDFDITLQVHRKKLGKIVFIPKAINFTQDPQTLSDFVKQSMRWQRGFFQGVKKYNIGLRGQRIDVSLGFQMGQTLVFLLQICVLLPYLIHTSGSWEIVPIIAAADFIITAIIAFWASFAAKRWNLMGALPYFYFLRWLEIGIYFMAFFEVMVLGKFKDEVKGWGTEGRRYKISANALSEVAVKA